MSLAALQDCLDRRAAEGRPARLWLRDDDVTEPSPALERLIGLELPVTLAAIPARVGAALARRLAAERHVAVAVHGWSHANHARPHEKAQELGPHRPPEIVAAELAQGLHRMREMFGPQAEALLVPPWNRIDAALLPHLAPLGYRAVSTFGPERNGPLPVVNTHLDLIDWRGTRQGRPADALATEAAARLALADTLGILTHHLVHDAAAWDFLDRLADLTKAHPGCTWVSVRDLIPTTAPPFTLAQVSQGSPGL